MVSDRVVHCFVDVEVGVGKGGVQLFVWCMCG
jgi:hypothetical protein